MRVGYSTLVQTWMTWLQHVAVLCCVLKVCFWKGCPLSLAERHLSWSGLQLSDLWPLTCDWIEVPSFGYPFRARPWLKHWRSTAPSQRSTCWKRHRRWRRQGLASCRASDRHRESDRDMRLSLVERLFHVEDFTYQIFDLSEEVQSRRRPFIWPFCARLWLKHWRSQLHHRHQLES